MDTHIWENLWATAIYDLHLSDTHFWSLTPREFDMLVERWILEQERQDRRFAGVSKILVEVNSTKKSRKYKLEDFMIHNFRGTIARKPVQTWQEQRALLTQVHAQMGAHRK